MSKKSRSHTARAGGFSPWTLVVGVVIVLLLAGGGMTFGGCLPVPLPNDGTAVPPPSITAPPDDNAVTDLPRANVVRGDWYTVYFTKPSYPEKKENRSGGIDAAIAADIDRAQKTIDAAVFDFRLPALVDAFVRAAQRGVRVRLVTDYAANQGSKEYTDAIEKMEKGGVQVVRDHRSALMHDKFAIIDNHLLWTGSMNFTPNDVYRNNNNMLRLALPQLIENYATRFERMVQLNTAAVPPKEIPHPRITLDHGATIENYFSPTGGAQKAVLDKLKAARKNIQITAFTFTDTPMGDVLKAQNKANVTVQGVFETRNNGGIGAEYPGLKRAGLDILEDGNCYTMHSKTMVLDNRIVITGSYNWTANADKANDENMLIIEDAKLAQAYGDEFKRIYQHAQAPTQCGANSLEVEPETAE